MQSNYMNTQRFSQFEDDPFCSGYGDRTQQFGGNPMFWNEDQPMGMNPYQSQQYQTTPQFPQHQGMRMQQERNLFGRSKREQLGEYPGSAQRGQMGGYQGQFGPTGFQEGQTRGMEGPMGADIGQLGGLEGNMSGMSSGFLSGHQRGYQRGHMGGIQGQQRGQFDPYQRGLRGGQRFGIAEIGTQNQPWMCQHDDMFGDLFNKLNQVMRRVDILTTKVGQHRSQMGSPMDEQLGQQFRQQSYGLDDTYSGFGTQSQQTGAIGELFNMLSQLVRKVDFLTNKVQECQLGLDQDQMGGMLGGKTSVPSREQRWRQQPFGMSDIYGGMGTQNKSYGPQQSNILGMLFNKINQVVSKVDFLTNQVQGNQLGGFQGHLDAMLGGQSGGSYREQMLRQQPYGMGNIYGGMDTQNESWGPQQSNILGALFNKLNQVVAKVDVLTNQVQRTQLGSYQGQMGGLFDDSQNYPYQQPYRQEDIYGGYGNQLQQTDLVSNLWQQLNKVLRHVDILTNKVMGGQGMYGDYRQMESEISPFQSGQLGSLSELDFQRQPKNQTFVRSTVHHYKKEGEQEPQVYEVHHSHITGPNGLLEKKKTIKDTAKKIEKEFHAKYLKGKGYAKETITNTDTNESQESYSYDGLTEDDIDQFEKRWEEANKTKDQQKQQQSHQQQWGHQQKWEKSQRQGQHEEEEQGK